MSGLPAAGPWNAIRAELLRPGRRRVVVAIGYVGATAPLVMPLSEGDVLVCDASRVAIQQGLTSVRSLRSYRRNGVSVFSLPGLHSKVVSFPTAAWVGSANASSNSEHNLIEASVRVTGRDAQVVRQWAQTLATKDRELSSRDLTELARIPVARARPQPTAAAPLPRILPHSVRSLVFVETGEALTVREKASVESDRHLAQNAARFAGFPSTLDHIYSVNGTTAKAGDWLVDIRSGHPRRPAYVVRVTRRNGDSIIWLSRVATPRRPNIAQLRSLVANLRPFFGEVRVSHGPTLRKVLSLYR